HALAAVGANDAQALELHLQRDAVRLEHFAWARSCSEAGMAALIHALAAVGANDAQALELHLQRDAVRLEHFAWARS
ncbi:hypothetical protein CKQ90_35140, partial [Klebsiella pneumoniae]